jgi:tight adherence protein C
VSTLGPRASRWVKWLETAQYQRLIWAGTPGGLTVYECFFCSVLGLMFGVCGGLFLSQASQSWTWLFPCAAVGGSLLQIRLRALATERLLQIKHQLPSVVDLVALAMQAGADLPSALTKIVERQMGVVGDELRQLLFALDMGLTRRAALMAFEERCPVDEVRDLVRTVVMAEQKGASVADALVQQATTSRQRRSVRAEESAAQAGVLLMLPIMLLMGCVLILLVGPLVCVSSRF